MGMAKQTNAKATGLRLRNIRKKFDDYIGPSIGFANPQIIKINVNRSKLDKLLNKFAQWKEDYAQILQQYDLKLQHNRDKQAMLNSDQVSHSFFLLHIDLSGNNPSHEHFHR